MKSETERCWCTDAKCADKCQRGREPVIREDGAIEIPLTDGQVALVDAQDYTLVRDVLWTARWEPSTKSYRAQTTAHSMGRATVLMHRAILGVETTPGVDVDHIRQDSTLDNRRSNLRIATRSENLYNQRHRGGSSRFKGVIWRAKMGKWQAYISPKSGWTHIGYFDNEADAARAYDSAARRHFGDRAFTNEDAGLL